MEEKSGIVVKVTENYIVLIMPDGSFKNVKRSKTQVPLIGERFTYKEERHSVFYSRWTAVAAVACMIVLAVFTYRLLMTSNSQPAYLVALDINPSVEVYVDKNLVTTNVTALNEDGKKLTDMAQYKGKKLLDTIDLIVEQSISKGYLKQNQKGLIKITVIPMQKNNSLNGDNIKTSIQKLLLKDNIQAEIEIGFDTRDIIEEAHQSGLSINRYILYKSLRDKGISITVEESRNMPLENLQNYEATRNNDSNGRITPQPNTSGGEKSGKPDNSGEQGYKDGNAHKKNQNGEMPDKRSIPETLKGSDTQKSKTNNNGETGMADKMGTEKSEISSSSQPVQTNNSADGSGKTENSNNSISTPVTKDIQSDGSSDSKPNQTNQNGSSIESPNKDGSQPSSSGSTGPQSGQGSGSSNTGKKR
ncbi:MAG: hypothetical protein QHH06_13500 [Clostridiales bacterium]|jgi:hypothetical protein|nr:hypothetical protein [Eubacteriales bacterium]MDH7567457.1 hypothetical protein [Clostridiales bacterium]